MIGGLLWAQSLDSLPTYLLPTVPIEGALGTSTLVLNESSTERLQREGLIQPVYRSVPFAQEVVYQGLLPTQTSVSIEGMRVLPACVDRMDPALTFLEGSIFVRGYLVGSPDVGRYAHTSDRPS